MSLNIVVVSMFLNVFVLIDCWFFVFVLVVSMSGMMFSRNVIDVIMIGWNCVVVVLIIVCCNGMLFLVRLCVYCMIRIVFFVVSLIIVIILILKYMLFGILCVSVVVIVLIMLSGMIVSMDSGIF